MTQQGAQFSAINALRTGNVIFDMLLAMCIPMLFKLLEETHAAFAPSGRVITMAYYPDGRQERLFTQYGVGKYVANMHAMSYDQGGKHSTYEFANQVGVQALRIRHVAQSRAARRVSDYPCSCRPTM